MQWTWCLECDIQLFLLIPIYVLVYQKFGATAGKVLSLTTFIAGIIISQRVASHYKITAGIFTMENENLYSMFMNKPYCKLSVYSLGILSAMAYIDIKSYKIMKLKRGGLQEAASTYPLVHLATKKKGQ